MRFYSGLARALAGFKAKRELPSSDLVMSSVQKSTKAPVDELTVQLGGAACHHRC